MSSNISLSIQNEIKNYKNFKNDLLYEIEGFKNENISLEEEVKKYNGYNFSFLNNIKSLYANENLDMTFKIKNYKNNTFFAFERIGYEQVPPVRIIFKNFED